MLVEKFLSFHECESGITGEATGEAIGKDILA